MKMTHSALPVRVHAVQVTEFRTFHDDYMNGRKTLAKMADGTTKDVTDVPGVPKSGSYLVTREDGSQHLTPQQSFESRYQAIAQRVHFDQNADVASQLRGLANEVEDRGEEIDTYVAIYGRLGVAVWVSTNLSSMECVSTIAMGQHVMLNTLMPNGNTTE